MQKLISKKLILIACIALPGLSIAAELQDVVAAIQTGQQSNVSSLDSLAKYIGQSDDNTRNFIKSLYDTAVQANTELMFQKSPVEALTTGTMSKLGAADQFANAAKLNLELGLWEKSMLGFPLPFYVNGTLFTDSTIIRPIKDLSPTELKDDAQKAATAEYQLYNKLLYSCSNAAVDKKAIKGCKSLDTGDMTAAEAAYAPYKLSTLLGRDGYALDSNHAIMAQDFISTLLMGIPQENVQKALQEGQSQVYVAKALMKEAQYSTARYALTEAFAQRLQQPPVKSEDGTITPQLSEMELMTKFIQDSLSAQTLSGIAQSSAEALLRSLYYQIAFNNSIQLKLYKQGERMEALMAANFARQGAEVKEQNENAVAARGVMTSPAFMK
jgi:hypothetical protein